MNCYFVGMLYGKSGAKFPYFVPIVRLIYPSYAVLGCDWPVKKILSKIFGQINWHLLEPPMEGSVLSFLKTEWQVSDTSTVYWASSIYSDSLYHLLISFYLIENNWGHTKYGTGSHFEDACHFHFVDSTYNTRVDFDYWSYFYNIYRMLLSGQGCRGQNKIERENNNYMYILTLLCLIFKKRFIM